jgi:hypothetical protein
LKVDGRDGRDPQNREKNAPAGRFTCMRDQNILKAYFSKTTKKDLKLNIK